MTSDGDWSEWRNHVLKELERQNDNNEALNDKLDTLNSRLDTFEKTCLQKEGDQKVNNAVTALKIYYMDAVIGGASAILVLGVQYLLSH
jgi:hypothetical protein